jgi:hypothetical protein
MSSTAQELAGQAVPLQQIMSFFRFHEAAPVVKALPQRAEQTGIAVR